MFNNSKKNFKNNIQIASFLINDPKLTETWGNVYIVEPSNEREKKLGQLIVLTALSDFSSKTSQKEIIERIIKEMQINYYRSDVHPVRKDGALDLIFSENKKAGLYLSPQGAGFSNGVNKENLNIEEIFETILQKANQEFAKIIRISQNNWFKKINILVVIVKNESIYFAQIGSLFSAFLIHEDRIIDIIEKVRANNIPVNPLKLFSSITNGSISVNDNIFFTSSGIFDFISSEKIKRIINDWEVNSAISKFQNLLSISNAKSILTGVIIKNNYKKTEAKLIPTNNSLFELANQRKKTDKVLKPSFVSNLLKVQKKWFNLSSAFLTRYRAPQKDHINPFIPAVNRDGAFWKALDKFKSFSRLSKILFIAALILALFLVYSVIWLARKQTKDNQIKENKQLLEKIENKQNVVGAALIYKDEKKAGKTLEEILKLSEKLSKDSPENLARLQKIQKETEIQLNQLRNITVLENPLMITDLNLLNSNPSAGGENFNLVFLNQQLYFYNQDNSIFKFDFKEKKIFSVFKDLQDNKLFENAKPYDKNSILFSSANGNEIVKFNILNKNLESIALKLPIETKKIEDFVVYSQKIYLLDSGNNQIYKYYPAQTNFGEKNNWLKDEQVNLNEGVSMAIDGAVYVLKSNGEVLKFIQGKKQEFVLKNLELALKNPTKIWTSFNSKYIYILDPETKRLIILDKQGKVQKQYTSEKFIHLKNFVVDEQKNKFYILADNKVYELKAEY
ncbi:hypothetical protein HY750_02765 [Candidatus Kuenenbacteria bacterium]|nr:hypothetical protein [Candidatus Kuenenbacteria bacterium]